MQFILDSPHGLSDRARRFLATSGVRVSVQKGLVGESLQQRIVQVYGAPNPAIEDRLILLQSRYAGLTYRSSFFDSKVVFSPVCEPEDAEEELEILRAVETQSPVGASVKGDGRVEIGLDCVGEVEFDSLDHIVECDALFAESDQSLHRAMRTFEYRHMGRVVEVLTSRMTEVVEGCGSTTRWFRSGSVMVFVTGIWWRLGGVTLPTVRVWGEDSSAVAGVVKEIDDALGLATS